MASTMRDSTLAVSSMGSPRPSCMSDAVEMITEPPSWRMAASNEKRVRVEFFSKIMASVRPVAGASASARPFVHPARAFLRAWASSTIARRSSAVRSQMSRKWRVIRRFP